MSRNTPRSRSATAESPASYRANRSTAPRRRVWTQWLWWGASRALFWFVVSSVGVVVLLKWVPVLVTPTMLDRKWETDNSEIHYDWTPLSDLDPKAALAAVAAEDQRFPQHYGFDFDAMNSAFRHNWRGKRLKGASTISQQVAKNVFLWQGRSYFRKALEAWFTLLIETIWGKRRILEVYLNVAETGPMTFGFEAASQRFFGHSARSLSRTEAARLAAVLPSPRRFSAQNPSPHVQRRTAFITRQMRGLGRNYVAGL